MPKIQLISRDEVFEIGDADCAFGIRRMHPDVLRDIRRQNTKRVEPSVEGFGPRWETDEAEVEKDMLDWIIQYWRGVVGPDGTEAGCTRDHKWVLPGSVKTEIFAAAGAANLEGDSPGPLRPLKPTSKEKAEAPSGTEPPGRSPA